MAEENGMIWMNGKIVPWEQATTHVLSHSLHYGLAVFEGMRAYKTDNGPAIFRLTEHLQRLHNSAKIYMMKIPHSVSALSDACVEVVRQNRLESGYVRPISFYGPEKGRLSRWSNG